MSGILGCAVLIGLAFVIAKTVPKSEIKTGRSWYNATGPAVAQGVKWVFGMMAQPWREIPLCGKGEPFAGLQIVGAGLTQRERRMLLAAVQTSKSMISPKLGLIDSLMWIGPVPLNKLVAMWGQV